MSQATCKQDGHELKHDLYPIYKIVLMTRIEALLSTIEEPISKMTLDAAEFPR